MRRGEFSFARIWLACRLAVGATLICVGASWSILAAQQPSSDVPPDATPEIQQINPAHAVPGAHLTVIIQGSNFSDSAYASSTSAAIHVDASKRVSATQLEVQVTVSASAQPGTVSLQVSNPASQVAETTFTIITAETQSVPATPPQNQKPADPTAPATPQTAPAPAAPQTPAAPVPPTAPAPPAAPANPASPAAPPATAPPAQPAAPGDPASPPSGLTPPAGEPNPAALPAPAAPAAPSAPVTPDAPPAPASPAGPEVAAVNPARVGQGFDVDLKITGHGFSPKAKVSFANQGVRLVGITTSSSTALTVHIKVAGDAAVGKSSLFVINPDDNEAEVPFEVVKKGTVAPPPQNPNAPGTVPAADPTLTQRFDAFHFGNPTEIFHTHGKVKGALVISEGTAKYQEDGKTLINISLSEIKDVKTSPMGGFRIIVNSGKTTHFAAASLKGSDARVIVDALEKAMAAGSAQP